MGSFFPSLQVFQEAASLFLDLLGKLLAQPDDSEPTFRRDSLMVIFSRLQISVFPAFFCISPSPSYDFINTANVDFSPCAIYHMSKRVPALTILKIVEKAGQCGMCL